jgi:tRNA pseudouridine55 synthase
VRASAGFYVRSLAHDLGLKLGCGGHLETLRRAGAGSFVEKDAVSLTAVEKERHDAARWILPLEQLLPDIPAVVLSDRDRARVTHGADVAPALSFVERADDGNPRLLVGADVTHRRLFDTGGRLVALAEMRPGGFLHPVIVLV